MLNKQDVVVLFIMESRAKMRTNLQRHGLHALHRLFFFNALEFIKIQILILVYAEATRKVTTVDLLITNHVLQEIPLYLLIDTASFLFKAAAGCCMVYIVIYTASPLTPALNVQIPFTEGPTYVCSILIVRWNASKGLKFYFYSPL